MTVRRGHTWGLSTTKADENRQSAAASRHGTGEDVVTSLHVSQHTHLSAQHAGGSACINFRLASLITIKSPR